MAIQIIKTDERLELEYEGGIFYYRRPPLKMKKKWLGEIKDLRGNWNEYAMIEKYLPYCFIGWKDGAVIDEDGKNVAFDQKLVFEMPENFYGELSAALGISQPDQEENESKNSKGTSSKK